MRPLPSSSKRLAILPFSVIVTVVALALATGCSTAKKKQLKNGTSAPGPDSAIIISIDGLRPEFYLSDQFNTPNLHRLKSLGAFTEAVLPPYPSSTFPSHATMATGVAPAKHGVVSNTIFSQETGPTLFWYWETSHLKAPPLWDAAKKAGKTVAIFGWPGSAGAAVDWIIPEVFSPYGIDHDENWKYTVRATDPGFLAEIQSITTVPKIRSSADYDRWMSEAAIHILKTKHPGLAFIHLRNLDETQHLLGVNSPGVRDAVSEVDARLGEILENVDLSTTLVIVTGDHGFDEVTGELNLNVWFKKQGWLQVKDGKLLKWSVIAHPNGNQAAIYAKSAAFAPRVLKSLKELQKATGLKVSIFDKAELRRLGGFPEALFSVDAPESFSLGSALTGDLIRKLPKAKGTHGALAGEGRLRTGLILLGPEVSGNVKLPILELMDVAPTIAKNLGIPFSGDGKPIEIPGTP